MEEDAVRQPRERVVEGLVGHRRDGLGVVEGEARVLGQRAQDVLLGLGVAPPRLARGRHQRADDLAVLVHGDRHRGGDVVVAEGLDRPGVGLVVLDEHQAALRHGLAADALADGAALEAAGQLALDAERGGHVEDLRILGVAQQQGGQRVAEQVVRRLDDRRQHLGQRRAVGDRPLDLRQALEELLALLGLVARAQQADGQGQRAGHAAQQRQLDAGQRRPGPDDDHRVRDAPSPVSPTSSRATAAPTSPTAGTGT